MKFSVSGVISTLLFASVTAVIAYDHYSPVALKCRKAHGYYDSFGAGCTRSLTIFIDPDTGKATNMEFVP